MDRPAPAEPLHQRAEDGRNDSRSAGRLTRILENIYSMLFESFGPQHWWPGETPFEIMVGAILTQNTNWSNVEMAIANLKGAGVLSPAALKGLKRDRLARLIRPAGYFNVKAGRLKNFIHYLMSRYGGSIAGMRGTDTGTLRKELLAVNGIGEETADSILLYALGRPVFVIDAYTKRILSRHRIMAASVPYAGFQELFHAHLPRDARLFNEYHALLVRTGKEFCRPRPRCSGCPLERGV